MKNRKQIFWLVFFIIIAIAIYLRYIYNQGMKMAQEKNYTDKDFQAGLPKVVAAYGKDIAKRVEQIFRLETAHFKSVQYQKTGTPGMEVFGMAPYYGWHAPFFVMNPSYTPLGTFTMPENKTGISKTFIVMPSVEAAMMFLADYIKRHNNPARWYSKNADSQAKYLASLNSIIPRFTNQIA